MHENNIGSVIIETKDDNNNIKPVGMITERYDNRSSVVLMPPFPISIFLLLFPM
jgi:hypothetical protein